MVQNSVFVQTTSQANLYLLFNFTPYLPLTTVYFRLFYMPLS